MEKIIINGGRKLKGITHVSGAKNVAMKVILAGLLTDKPIYIKNTPLISSIWGTADIVKPLGVKIDIKSDHSMTIKGDNMGGYSVPLELGGLYRTATMVLGPLLARYGKAEVPNPGGCRLGKRPIDRHIQALEQMGAKIRYKDGFFYAEASALVGSKIKFSRNTHTGTETVILAAVLARGETVIENAASEPEIDNLILLLNMMGAKIKRKSPRLIVISGVKQLRGAEFEIMPDRNEVVTFAIAGVATGGDIIIEGAQKIYLKSFLTKLDETGSRWKEIRKDVIRFYRPKTRLSSCDVVTRYHPGFMTDWQAPWALLMTQAQGVSTIHETVYEDRFGYVPELLKMGASISFFDPKIKNPSDYYNFNWSDWRDGKLHAIRIYGPTTLHNAILEVTDLRAGATLVLGALLAHGQSVVHGVEHIDRGYEKIEERLRKIGADIKRINK